MPLSPQEVVRTRELVRREVFTKAFQQIDRVLLTSFGRSSEIEIPWTDFEPIFSEVKTVAPIQFDDLRHATQNVYKTLGWEVEEVVIPYLNAKHGGTKGLRFRPREGGCLVAKQEFPLLERAKTIFGGLKKLFSNKLKINRE